MTDDMTRIIRKLNRSGQTHAMFEAFKRMHGRYPGLREGAVFAVEHANGEAKQLWRQFLLRLETEEAFYSTKH